MDVDAYMDERRPMIEAGIEARFPAGSNRPKELDGAMRHLLFPGGKRLRPVFAIAAAEAIGGAGAAPAALPIAVAVELVHTYSLIHDDLPCMDDDVMRRGRPTVHVAYDEATAVLAGDALLTEAFAVLTEPSGAGRDAETLVGVVHRLATAAGAAGLVGGQIDDLRFEAESGAGDRSADQIQLASIHARKTAALFQAAIVGGAALAGGQPNQLEALDRFAKAVGIAFQIADDLLDADSEEAASILRIQGIEDARRGSDGLIEGALSEIHGFCERAEPLRELARFAVRRNR